MFDMKSRATQSKRKKRSPEVGDRVTLKFGTRKVYAVVIEDRGPLGVGGQKILRVRLLSVDPESEFEVRADDVLHVRATA